MILGPSPQAVPPLGLSFTHFLNSHSKITYPLGFLWELNEWCMSCAYFSAWHTGRTQEFRGWQTLVHGPHPGISCAFMAHVLRMVLRFWMVEKKKEEEDYFDMWKWYKIQMSVCINKVLLEHRHPSSFIPSLGELSRHRGRGELSQGPLQEGLAAPGGDVRSRCDFRKWVLPVTSDYMSSWNDTSQLTPCPRGVKVYVKQLIHFPFPK